MSFLKGLREHLLRLIVNLRKPMGLKLTKLGDEEYVMQITVASTRDGSPRRGQQRDKSTVKDPSGGGGRYRAIRQTPTRSSNGPENIAPAARRGFDPSLPHPSVL